MMMMNIHISNSKNIIPVSVAACFCVVLHSSLWRFVGFLSVGRNSGSCARISTKFFGGVCRSWIIQQLIDLRGNLDLDPDTDCPYFVP